MISKMYLLTYYDSNENAAEKRNYSLSSVNKVNYILDALNSKGVTVEIISASESWGKRLCKAKTLQIFGVNKLHLFLSIGKKNKLIRIVDVLLLQIQILMFLVKHLKKGDCLFVYHALGYMRILQAIVKLKKVRLILEMEEIYSDVSGNNKMRSRELQIAGIASAFVFPTKLLNDVVNVHAYPYVISHGTYHVETERKCGFDDGKIHVVYAGTLDAKKGGAFVAVKTAEYLPPNYHVHILGFGSDEQIKLILQMIEHTSQNGGAEVSYEGVLTDENYILFLQSCQIGLSTQNPDCAYNDTSFPSKILSYMSNGLRVVSVKIPVVEQSDVADLITYYTIQSPECVAEAIQSIDMSFPYDSRERVRKLDENFKDALYTIVESLEG